MISIGNDGETSITWQKILIISVVALVIFILLIYILRENIGRNIIKIQLSDNNEITVLTSKTKVSDILKESNIVLAENEITDPPLDAKMTNTNIIKIILIEPEMPDDVELLKQVSNMMQAGKKSVDKREATLPLLEAIPFDIITEDLSDGSKNNTMTVVQYGKIGLKEITYKVTYENNVEVDREEMFARVVREPIDHIIQIQKVTTTTTVASRPETRVADFTALLPEEYVITAYCACMKCCGKTDGITASGMIARANHTIASSEIFGFGTQLRINGIIYTVEDRGGAIQGNRLDIYMNTHEEAIAWGVKVMRVEVLCDIYGI